jgi:hypothetical protein
MDHTLHHEDKCVCIDLKLLHSLIVQTQ